MLEPDSVAKAMSFQCSCVPSCTLRWTRQNLFNARHSYLTLTLAHQMRRVYDILLSQYDHSTETVGLTIGGVEQAGTKIYSFR